jgi:hypothetical protein
VYLLGIIEQNCHIIYEKVTGKKIEHWEFLLQLAIQLSGIYSIDTPVIVQRKCWEHKPTHRIIYNPMPSKLSSFVFSHQTNIKTKSIPFSLSSCLI